MILCLLLTDFYVTFVIRLLSAEDDFLQEKLRKFSLFAVIGQQSLRGISPNPSLSKFPSSKKRQTSKVRTFSSSFLAWVYILNSIHNSDVACSMGEIENFLLQGRAQEPVVKQDGALKEFHH